MGDVLDGSVDGVGANLLLFSLTARKGGGGGVGAAFPGVPTSLPIRGSTKKFSRYRHQEKSFFLVLVWFWRPGPQAPDDPGPKPVPSASPIANLSRAVGVLFGIVARACSDS